MGGSGRRERGRSAQCPAWRRPPRYPSRAALGPQTPDVGTPWTLAISCLGLFLGACLYGPIAIFGVAATESAPAHLSGTSHAVAALAASVGAVISGLPFSLLAQNRSWGDVFLLLEVACAATAAILFLGRNLAAGIGRPKTH
ncbi:putative glucose-6-phosphate translocase [Ixodes scapularis]